MSPEKWLKIDRTDDPRVKLLKAKIEELRGWAERGATGPSTSTTMAAFQECTGREEPEYNLLYLGTLYVPPLSFTLSEVKAMLHIAINPPTIKIGGQDFAALPIPKMAGLTPDLMCEYARVITAAESARGAHQIEFAG